MKIQLVPSGPHPGPLLAQGEGRIFLSFIYFYTMNTHNKASLKDIRRSLRQVMTDAEAVLWEELRNKKFRDLKFKRQHSIGNYIVDFYCANPRLIIEVDGAVHSEKEQKGKDEHRDANLRDMDYIVLRFSNDEVINDTQEVLKKIEIALL
jgi:very-short-patch-repair endonuclease